MSRGDHEVPPRLPDLRRSRGPAGDTTASPASIVERTERNIGRGRQVMEDNNTPSRLERTIGKIAKALRGDDQSVDKVNVDAVLREMRDGALSLDCVGADAARCAALRADRDFQAAAFGLLCEHEDALARVAQYEDILDSDLIAGVLRVFLRRNIRAGYSSYVLSLHQLLQGQRLNSAFDDALDAAISDLIVAGEIVPSDVRALGLDLESPRYQKLITNAVVHSWERVLMRHENEVDGEEADAALVPTLYYRALDQDHVMAVYERIRNRAGATPMLHALPPLIVRGRDISFAATLPPHAHGDLEKDDAAAFDERGKIVAGLKADDIASWPGQQVMDHVYLAVRHAVARQCDGESYTAVSMDRLRNALHAATLTVPVFLTRGRRLVVTDDAAHSAAAPPPCIAASFAVAMAEDYDREEVLYAHFPAALLGDATRNKQLFMRTVRAFIGDGVYCANTPIYNLPHAAERAVATSTVPIPREIPSIQEVFSAQSVMTVRLRTAADVLRFAALSTVLSYADAIDAREVPHGKRDPHPVHYLITATRETIADAVQRIETATTDEARMGARQELTNRLDIVIDALGNHFLAAHEVMAHDHYL